jgi:hypothetical protein
MKLLIDLFDYSGNAAQPYREAGWRIIQVDKKRGFDIKDFLYKRIVLDHLHDLPEIGIIAAIPCTAYALSGNKHKGKPYREQVFKESQELVAMTKEIIDFFDSTGLLKFWMIEQPRTDIHTKNPWIGKIRQRFHPWQFAGYDPVPDDSRYRKWTWCFGNFNLMTHRPLEPLQHEFPGFTKLGGKSEKTKELRSITPLGFAYAFFHANH